MVRGWFLMFFNGFFDGGGVRVGVRRDSIGIHPTRNDPSPTPELPQVTFRIPANLRELARGLTKISPLKEKY
jgi:hypothetical protein